MNFNLLLPSKIVFGSGSTLHIGEHISDLKLKKALVVTSRGMLNREYFGRIMDALQEAGINTKYFAEVTPEPSIDDVDQCKKACEKGTDLVMGLGGGSVIDVAKMVGADLGLYKMMIPTTSGTGSEVTHESVIKKGGKKAAIVKESLLPHIAIVDPELSMSMPLSLAISTGLDALAHAVECYESKSSNYLVRVIAGEAYKLIRDNFKEAVRGTEKAQINMSLGSLMAGMAFGNSGTALGHALSYPLSNRGVSHGNAVAAVLPHALIFNKADPELVEDIKEVVNSVTIDWDFSWDIDEMTNEVMQDDRHLSNNPIYPSYEDIVAIFRKLEGNYKQ